MTTESSKDKALINALLAKLEEERREKRMLQSQLEELTDSKALKDSYENQIQQKDKVISKQEEQLSSLKAYVEWLKRKLFGKMSERHPDVDLPGQLTFDFGELKVTPEEEEAFQKAAEEVEQYYVKRKQASDERKAKNKPSRNALPENLPRDYCHLYPEGYNEQEWELLPDSYNEITETLVHKPEEFRVLCTIRHKAVRKDTAERHIECAPMPMLPIAKSYASSSLLSYIVNGKYVDHLPFHRQIEIFKRVGITLPASTVNGWFLDVADLLRPLYYRIRDLVLESDYVQADETTVPIVQEEKHKTVKGYLWQVCAVIDNLSFFHYDKGSRSYNVAQALFAHYQGALQTDGYQAYDIYENKSGVLLLNCWAHTRRDFERALSNDRPRASVALKNIGLLYEIERKADDDGLTFEEREDLRQRLAIPILMGFERWLQAEKPKVLPKSPIGKAINYALTRFDQLCRYCADGRYKIDTNMVERGQRPIAMGRKAYLFCTNDDAAEDAAVIYTMAECCRRIGVDFVKWLEFFLDHIHEYDTDYSRPLDELLPSAYKNRSLTTKQELQSEE